MPDIVRIVCCFPFAFCETYTAVGHCIAMGGINSALTNLVFDMVKPQMRSNALALSQAASGIAGFLTTLAVSVLMSYIQENDNTFLGMNLYAQQVASAIAALLTFFSVVHVVFAVHSRKGK